MRPLFSALLLLWVAPSAWGQEDLLPPGSVVEDALVLDLTEQGGGAAIGALTSLLPTGPGTVATSQVLDCPLDCTSSLTVDLTDLVVETALMDGTVVTEPGVVHFVLDLDLSVNHATSPALLVLGDGADRACDDWDPCCAEDRCITDTCTVWAAPVPVLVDIPVAIAVSDADGPGGAPPTFDVTVGTVVHDLEAALRELAPVVACEGSADTPLWLANNLGSPVADALRTDLTTYVEQQLPSAFASLDVIFDSLAFDTSLDLGAVPVDLALSIADVEIGDQGLRMSMDGMLGASGTAACVQPYDPGGSVQSTSPLPAFTDRIPASGRPYDFGLLLGEDFLHQATYALWQSGALCFSVADAGLALDSDLLGRALGDETLAAMQEIFPDGPAPMSVDVVPTRPPAVQLTAGPDVRIWLRDLQLQVVAEVDGRLVRFFVGNADLPLDLSIGFTEHGEVALGIALSWGAAVTSVTPNELLVAADAAMEQALPGFLEGMVDQAIGDFLGTLYLGPLQLGEVAPTQGMTLTRGIASHHVEAFAVLEVPTPGSSEGGIDISGCEALGCLSEGCGDCDSRGGGSTAPILVALVTLLVGRRRRRGF